MKFLIVDTYYPDFLRTFYARHPDLPRHPYAEQWRLLMDQCFGTADFYSDNLRRLGYEAAEVVANCELLQHQWAKEQGVDLNEDSWSLRLGQRLFSWTKGNRTAAWFYQVLIEQVLHYRPDVLHIQDMNGTSPDFLRKARPYVRLITGQIACPIAPRADFRGYDLVLSSFPHFVDKFRNDGLASEYFNLGFEPRVLEKLKKKPARYPTVFVGGLSSNHGERIKLLGKIVASQSLDIWGYGADILDSKSVLLRSHHGQAWALDMYDIFYNADIALNHHINVAGRFANNMRLYEATGVGTLLLTDHKDNVHALFEPGKELVVYKSAEECVELITYYLEQEEERKDIAKAGQRRTLKEHTYFNRMQEFVELVRKYL
jgi:hypothetical protein